MRWSVGALERWNLVGSVIRALDQAQALHSLESMKAGTATLPARQRLGAKMRAADRIPDEIGDVGDARVDEPAEI